MEENRQVIEITDAGLYSIIQDGGRDCTKFYAIPSSGYMDTQAAQYANYILSNTLHHPVIECNLSGMGLRFHHPMHVALTGADFDWKLNGQKIELDKKIFISKGDMLTGSYGKKMARSYIAFDMDLDEKTTLGSYATYPTATIGANGGRILQKGDAIKLKKRQNTLPDKVSVTKPVYKNLQTIKIQKGPEWELLDQNSKRLFSQLYFQITSRSDRMAAHVTAQEKLLLREKPKNSNCIIPGMIQLNYDGHLMVILRDGQTTGGYPRVAYITNEQLNLFNQILPHRNFKFEVE